MTSTTQQQDKKPELVEWLEQSALDAISEQIQRETEAEVRKLRNYIIIFAASVCVWAAAIMCVIAIK